MPYGKGEEKKKQILEQGHSGHTLGITLSSHYRTKQGVCHNVALPFPLKSI
jgi:hypothetical protein